jgi:hypothetical protein
MPRDSEAPRHFSELLVVDRQDEGRCAALLLRKAGEVTVAGCTDDFHAFRLDRLGQCTDAEAGGVLGTEVLVDDDDREAETHRCGLRRTESEGADYGRISGSCR